MSLVFKYTGFIEEWYPPTHTWEIYEDNVLIGHRHSTEKDDPHESYRRRDSAKDKLEALGITKEELKSLLTERW